MAFIFSTFQNHLFSIGVRVKCGMSQITPLEKTIIYTRNDPYKRVSPKEDLNIILDELLNPFDDSVARVIKKHEIDNKPSQERDFFNLIVHDPLVREVITLFALGEEQVLYFLINTYKLDTIMIFVLV